MKSKQNGFPAPHPRQQFLEWYGSTPLGQALRMSQASYFKGFLQLTYNQTILQVGALGAERSYIDDEYLDRFIVADAGEHPAVDVKRWLRANPDELPFAHDSVDVAILPHLLEFEAEPRKVLAEIERVLKPEGRLFVLSFNPWSPSGMLRGAPNRPKPWSNNFLGSFQLMDWLHLLKFEAELSAGFGLSTSHAWFEPQTLLQKSKAHLAAAYGIKAIKRTHTLIPIKTQWIPANQFIPEQAMAPPLMRGRP